MKKQHFETAMDLVIKEMRKKEKIEMEFEKVLLKFGEVSFDFAVKLNKAL